MLVVGATLPNLEGFLERGEAVSNPSINGSVPPTRCVCVYHYLLGIF